MKKLTSIAAILCLTFGISTMGAFAADLSYGEYVAEVKEKTDINWDEIDEDRIILVDYTNYLSIKNGDAPIDTCLIMFTKDSKSIYTAVFHGRKCDGMAKDVALAEPLKYFDKDAATEYAEKSGLNKPTEIKTMYLADGTHMYVYDIISSGKEYIIPYYVMKDSMFNIVKNDECNVEIGTAYPIDEFIEICEKEFDLYNEYVHEKNRKEEENESYVTVVDGEDVNREPKNSDKKDTKGETKTDVKEETKTDTRDDSKSETKDTEKQKPTKLNTTEKADELKSKGLFKGTDSGYELDKTLTRAEGATMLVRLLGKEQDAHGGTYDEVFSDSPSGAWYYDSVMYAYKNGIIRGTSDTTFTPDRTMSAKEFTALVMRALGKEDTQPENALAEAAKLNLITGKTVTELENKGTFTRGDMVDIAYAAYKYSSGK